MLLYGAGVPGAEEASGQAGVWEGAALAGHFVGEATPSTCQSENDLQEPQLLPQGQRAGLCNGHRPHTPPALASFRGFYQTQA